MRDQIRHIFSQGFGKPTSVKEQFAKDVAGVVKNFEDNGVLDDGTRNELIKVTMETMRGLDDLKKSYLHRKNLLNKVISQVTAQAAQDEKGALKAHVTGMMQNIDDKLKKLDEDMKTLQQELDLIKKKQI